MDYLAVGKLDPVQAATIVQGVANACQEVGCALLGGETAEMPDVYLPGAFDLAGTIVGVVEKMMPSMEPLSAMVMSFWACHPVACIPTAIRWLDASLLPIRWIPSFPNWANHWLMRCSAHIAAI